MDIPALYNIYLKNPSVQTDTRKLKKGDIFFALKGPSFNGNSFAAQAIELGAAAAVIDDARFAIENKTILVEDVLTALQHLASYHRDKLHIPFIAITGSNGKTTTKELVHAVLSSKYRTTTTEGNLNNHIGVPLTLLRVPHNAEMAVIEMGANHQGEIASYCRIAKPTHGLITNCGRAHLEGFGSEEGVRKGKGELYDHLRSINHGHAFVMWDYEYLQQMSKGISGLIKYGTVENAHVRGRAKEGSELLEVEILQGMSPCTISTQLAGTYNLPNVLAAVTIGKFFGIDEEQIHSAIEKYTPSNSRSQLVKKDSNTFILDAYNANPSSMQVAIENFQGRPGKKILVLGSMAELGKESDAEHKMLIDNIGKYEWESVILVGKEFAAHPHSFNQFSNADEAGAFLKKINPKNVSILIKGSRSMRMEKVLDQI